MAEYETPEQIEKKAERLTLKAVKYLSNPNIQYDQNSLFETIEKAQELYVLTGNREYFRTQIKIARNYNGAMKNFVENISDSILIGERGLVSKIEIRKKDYKKKIITIPLSKISSNQLGHLNFSDQ